MSLSDLRTALSFLNKFPEKIHAFGKNQHKPSSTGSFQDVTLSPQALTRILNFIHQTQSGSVAEPHTDWDQQKIAAKVIRALLVDHLKNAADNTGSSLAVTPTIDQLSGNERARILATDQALHQLETLDPHLCEIVELRYFLGLDLDEVAHLTGHSQKTIEVKWRLAQTWLFQATEHAKVTQHCTQS